MFLIVEPRNDPGKEAPLWVCLHGGGIGYFEEKGEYHATGNQTQDNCNHEESAKDLMNSTRAFGKNRQQSTTRSHDASVDKSPALGKTHMSCLNKRMPMLSKYPATCALLKSASRSVGFEWQDDSSLLSDWLKYHWKEYDLPEFMPALASLEERIAELKESPATSSPATTTVLSPSLAIVESEWLNLPAYISGQDAKITAGSEFILLWQEVDGKVRCESATDQDLLAVKLVAEQTDIDKAAADHGVTVGMLDLAIRHGESRGFLLAPDSLIRRDPEVFQQNSFSGENSLVSPVFTLQWHITQECDYHCRHCYDRTERKSMSLEMGIGLLDDLRSFCKAKNVAGQIYFTGGNPLLHRDFLALYQAAADRGFRLAIMGNPAKRALIREIKAIEPLVSYQVSLEGLAEHNDEIRGNGTFQRALKFLEVLRQEKVFSSVMLTLTEKNRGQVLALAEFLRDKADRFNFNRLAMVGNGASLASAHTESYEKFLEDYYYASLENPCMGFKDNHFNSIFYKKGISASGGCTGFGCGAGFNFVAVLPDGEVHACRKFPSLIGNLHDEKLADIYDGSMARKYRAGSEACKGCPTRNVCGGCLAVAHGMGLDVFKDKDPYCFLAQ